MFRDIEKNKFMIAGAYKKLKSYYYYNKNYVFMKKKIAEFENEFDELEIKLNNLAELLLPTNTFKLENELSKWIELIDYYVIPKSFEETKQTNEQIITNDKVVNNPVNKVNFFIDMPIELYILDCLWTVLVGKIVYDKNLLSNSCYGNIIDNSVVYNHSSDYYSSINFEKKNLFKIYFNQYCSWKNNMLNTVKACNNAKKDVTLISLDIKSYYYSVCFNFLELDDLFENNINYKKITTLTDIIEKIYICYTKKLRLVRCLKQKDNETVLPIGLFSSMILGNLYLSKLDRKINSIRKVVYYGRYVDDILILIDSSYGYHDLDKNFLDKVLVEQLELLEIRENKLYSFLDRKNLYIQKEKVKIVYFEGGKSQSLIKKLEKTELIPSQMNIVPSADISIMDFEEAAYLIKGFQNQTKIRDLEQIEVDRFGLASYLTQFLQITSDKSIGIYEEQKRWKNKEIEKIINFFRESKCLEYFSNWINVLYIMVINNDKVGFRKIENNIRNAIKELKVKELDSIKKGKHREIKSRMKKCLLQHFEICESVAFAIYPGFLKSKKKRIELALKIRSANLFNHHLVTFPLVNYANNINETKDLSKLTISDIRESNYAIQNSPKIKWSPRFISLDEIFLWTFLKNEYKGGNYYSNVTDSEMKKIVSFFFRANNINANYAQPIKLEIRNDRLVNGYLLQSITLGKEVKINGDKKIKFAIANINLDTKICTAKIDRPNNIFINKSDFYGILKNAYDSKVDFLIFPEFYLPVEWLKELLTFARKTKITIVTGLNYVTFDNNESRRAINNVAVIAPFTNGYYENCFLLVREKNDYAPNEKEILALKKVKCYDQDEPNYQVFYNQGIRYGVFLCFEFTDIVARALYKNKVDIIFAPEHNKDTAYFASIIESMTRDLHIFIVQANTSLYGDSRITGPYDRNHRNILQIKGGEDVGIITGSIELGEILKEQEMAIKDFNKKLEDYFILPSNESDKELDKIISKEKDKKISKMSARTYIDY